VTGDVPRSYRDGARAVLAPEVFDYVDGAAGDERTSRDNRSAFARARVVPRVLVDVSAVDTEVTLLGRSLAAPVGVAPVAYQRLLHPEGERATATGAAAAGVLNIVSMFASTPLAEITAAGGRCWLQLYWLTDRGIVLDLAERALEAGMDGLVLTVDTPRLGDRRRDTANSFRLPPDVRAVNVEAVEPAGRGTMAAAHTAGAGRSSLANHAAASHDPSLSWPDLDWLRSRVRLPVVVKGVLSAGDATRAVDHGADGLVVSNHGGRQLDGAVASLDALPPVAAAVAGRVPVLLDGGVRRGVDVLVALSLGADVVLVARPVMWGLAVAGTAGVADVLSTLRAELELAMTLSGRPAIGDVDRAAVIRREGQEPCG
jgi:4-hydroxymandelate oxidase